MSERRESQERPNAGNPENDLTREHRTREVRARCVSTQYLFILDPHRLENFFIIL
jgi:hypothetical protein